MVLGESVGGSALSVYARGRLVRRKCPGTFCLVFRSVPPPRRSMSCVKHSTVCVHHKR